MLEGTHRDAHACITSVVCGHGKGGFYFLVFGNKRFPHEACKLGDEPKITKGADTFFKI